MYSNYQIIKNIGKLFSKYEPFSPDEADFSSDPFQILKPHPYSFPASLVISVKFPYGKLKLLFNATPIMFSIGFPIFFPTPFDHTYWIYQTICQIKPIRFIIKAHRNHNTLLIQHTTYPKQESLLFQSWKTWSITIITSIKSVLHSLQNSRCFFIFTTLLVHKATPTISIKDPFPLVSYFSPPYPALTYS